MTKKPDWYCLIDGKQLERPVTSGQVKKWLVDGTLSLSDKIRTEDSEWKEVSQFPKLVAIVEALKDSTTARGEEKVKAEGEVMAARIEAETAMAEEAKETEKASSSVLEDDAITKSEEESGDGNKLEHAEWMPQWFVSYSTFVVQGANWLVFVVALLFVAFKPSDISWMAATFITVVAIAVVNSVKNSLAELHAKLLNGQKGVFMLLNIGVGFITCIFAIAVLGLTLEEGKILAGLSALLMGAAFCGPWLYFAFKHRNDFREKELDALDAEERQQKAEGAFLLAVILAISCFVAFGLGGIIAFSMGSIVVGLVFHLGWVVIFVPWLYRTAKNRKKPERTE